MKLVINMLLLCVCVLCSVAAPSVGKLNIFAFVHFFTTGVEIMFIIFYMCIGGACVCVGVGGDIVNSVCSFMFMHGRFTYLCSKKKDDYGLVSGVHCLLCWSTAWWLSYFWSVGWVIADSMLLQTSVIFDIKLEGKSDGFVKYHYPVLSPLPIKPFKLLLPCESVFVVCVFCCVFVCLFFSVCVCVYA